MASMKRLLQAGLYVAVILWVIGGLLPASAQTSGEDAAALESWQGALDTIKVEIEKEFIAAHQFSDLLDAVNEIRPEIEALRNKYIPLVEDQKSVVAALAADSEDGENVQEDAKLIQEREKQEGILADLEATVKRARVLTATADNILGRIYARQRNQFAESLLEQRLSLLNPTLWQTAIAGFHSFVAISEQTISVWTTHPYHESGLLSAAGLNLTVSDVG